MMQLYGFWRSLATFRVRIVLNLKGIHIPEISIDLDRGDQDSSEYRAINPMGAVPALRLADGTTLTQSMSIMEWLEETEPVPKLLPDDPLARARNRALCAITVADTHPLIVPRVQAVLRHDWDDAKRLDWNRHWFAMGLAAYESHVGPGPFCAGTTPTLADVCLASHVVGAERFGVDLTPFAAVRRISDTCWELPEFRRAHPSRQPDAPKA